MTRIENIIGTTQPVLIFPTPKQAHDTLQGMKQLAAINSAMADLKMQKYLS